MRSKTTRSAVVPVCLCVLAAGAWWVNAGDLDPPAGPISPTQRTPVNANRTPGDADSTFRITEPGAYYLTGNITGEAAKHGIEIAVDDVTLDLMGFELAGVGGSLDGIAIAENTSNIAIENGVIRDFGGDGIDGVQTRNSRIERMRIRFCVGNGIVMNTFSTITECNLSGNGLNGISVSNSVLIERCVTGGNGGSGIHAAADDVTVETCNAEQNGGYGIYTGNGATLTGCIAGLNGTGISCLSDCRVRDCVARNNGGHGIIAEQGCNISGCTAVGNADRGIFTLDGAVVTDCTAQSNDGDGINVDTSSAVSACSSRGNTNDGIRVGVGSTVTECAAKFNSDDGIEAPSGCSVLHCTASENSGDGVQISADCQAIGNECHANGFGASDGAGIHVIGGDNRIEGNHIMESDRGLDIDGIRNIVADNTVMECADNYDIVAGNRLSLRLCEIPESIDWPAGVTLAGTLTGTSGANGVTINSDDVSIDLAGYALTGVTGSLDGIAVPAPKSNISIRNGIIHAWGESGISAASANNSQFSQLRVSGNGDDGMEVGDNCVVMQCTSESNGFDGIDVDTGCTVTNCASRSNGDNGIEASFSAVISNCTAQSNGTDGDGDGIQATTACSVTNCVARENTGDGIQVAGDGLVTGNVCDDNGFGAGSAAGIHATSSFNRIDGNTCTDNDIGIDVDAADNLIVRNSCGDNPTDNYAVVAGNKMGAESGNPATAGAWANFDLDL